MDICLGSFCVTITAWLVIGFLGQGLFSMRFIIQWFVSEKAKKSIVPTAFWYFSLAGGVTLFAYACYKRDPVFILGQGLGVFIYLRNIYFLYKAKRAKEVVPDPTKT